MIDHWIYWIWGGLQASFDEVREIMMEKIKRLGRLMSDNSGCGWQLLLSGWLDRWLDVAGSAVAVAG